jgi:hypothetical protein
MFNSLWGRLSSITVEAAEENGQAHRSISRHERCKGV